MNITIDKNNRIRQLYYQIMAAVSLFKYLVEQRDRKVIINIELEEEQ